MEILCDSIPVRSEQLDDFYSCLVHWWAFANSAGWVVSASASDNAEYSQHPLYYAGIHNIIEKALFTSPLDR